MAITKDKKREIVAKVSSALKNATSAVFVRFHKLTVADTTAMRRTLKKEGIGYYVAKKTLLARGLGERGITGTLPTMEGEIALVWSEGDPTAAARGVHEYVKKFKGALTIMGGVFENAFVDAVKMKEIATIPPIPVLRGMFVNVINSPIQGFVIALDAIAKKKSA